MTNARPVAAPEAVRGPLRHEWTRAGIRSPTVVLVSGLFDGGWMWETTWAALAREGFDAVRLRDPLAAWDAACDGLDAVREAVKRTLDPLPLNRYILCGNSMGSLVALDFARHWPARVAGLVLSGAPGLDDTENLGMGTPRRVTRQYVRQLADWIFHDRTRVTEQMLEWVHSLLSDRRHVVNAIRSLKAARAYDVPEALARIECPALLVWGERDRVTPPGQWALAARGLPRCEFRTVPACGHSPMIERPEEFNRILLPFLRSRRVGPDP